MLKWKIVKLSLYSLCFITVVIFICGVAYRFPLINAVGFKLTEYWALAVFGLIFSVSVGIYAAVKTIQSATSVCRAVKNKNAKNPVNLTKTAETESELSENIGGETSVVSEKPNTLPAQKPTADIKEKKAERKKSRAERRRERLLNEKKREKKFVGVFSFAAVIGCIIFSTYFACWALFPHKLCFHNFAYNLTENQTEPEKGEIRSYKFYQAYSGKPYVIYKFDEKSDAFRVYLTKTQKGTDEVGEYELYTFSGSHDYAKIFDKFRDKYTKVSTEITVKYYVSDAHIVVTHTAKKLREGVTETYDFSDKIYSYKNLSH